MIVKMKRLRLLAIRDQKDELLRELMLLGCVEVSELPVAPEDETMARLTAADSSELLRSRANQTTLMHAVKLLDRYAPAKSKLFQPPPDTTLSELLDDSKLQEDLELADKIISLDERIRRISADESRERLFIESLSPWRELDMPLQCKGTETAAAVLGAVPAATDMSALKAAASSVTDMSEIFTVSEDKEQKYLLLVCRKEEKDDVLSSLRPLNFSTASVGDNCSGTAKENIAAAGERLDRMAEEKQSIESQIAAEAGSRDELKLRIDTFNTVIARAEASSRVLCTDKTFVCEGWVPAEDEAKLAETLSKFDCAWETEDPDPEKAEEVPIKVKNNAATRPYKFVTEMYSLPSYLGIDPNPWLFPTFCLFFGIMFADLGYGILLLIGGLFIKYKLKSKGAIGDMGSMAIGVGISCMIFGFLTGTFFGNIIPEASKFFTGKEAQVFCLLDPLKEPMTVLIICLGIGIVHLLLGVAISGYMQIRDGHPIDALWDSGSIFLLFIGIALFVLVKTPIVLIIAVLAIIWAQGRGASSIGGKIGSGLYGLYSVVTGWFGDILSYSRLMALMLAGSVVAQVFNSLGAMTGNIVTFVIIFLIGHVLNIFLNLIGTFVHTCRLEYLEFFGKWYREGGRKFEPLAVNTKYYNIAK